ncbi:MAG: glutathione S-transferase family protein [Bdellovibrionota bacterium]
MEKETNLKLIGCRGTGSAIAEAFLTLADLSYEVEEVDYDKESKQRHYLRSLNPLIQVPTLVLPDQSVLTETFAIAQYAQLMCPEYTFIPSQDIHFWRWIMFINAAIYPTFTYGDSPQKWVRPLDGQKDLRKSTDDRRKQLWGQMEGQGKLPYFLGDEFSAIDIYIYVMSHWRPGYDWFVQSCPRLASIAQKVEMHPKLQDLWDVHFSTEG